MSEDATVVHRPLAEVTDFNSFLRRHGLTVVTQECTQFSGRWRFYAYLSADVGHVPGGALRSRVNIWEANGLAGAVAKGETADTAVLDLSRQILGRTLVVDAWGPNRRHIQCPNEWAEQIARGSVS